MKILNLYAGIGGNRKLWSDEHKITSIEYDEEIANVYKQHFPNDKVIVGDAHEFLLNNYKEFDFIWSSPPCPSHSRIRQNVAVLGGQNEAIYPDMKLYQEIILLKHHMEIKKRKIKKPWVVENVIPYYKPLIEAQKLGRHLFWSNFKITQKEFNHITFRTAGISDWEKFHGFDLSNYNGKNKRILLRNCVYPEVGKHVLECAIKDNDTRTNN